MIRSFALGFCAGAVATWWLKDSIPAQVDARTTEARAKVARWLRAVADAVEAGLSGAPARRRGPGGAHRPVVVTRARSVALHAERG